MALVTREAVKAALQLGKVDQVDDAAIDRALNAASTMIADHAGRTFEQTSSTQARMYEVTKGTVEVDDIATTTGLTVNLDGTLITSYTLHPRNALALGRPITRIGGLLTSATLVTVTATYGWPAIPAAVEQATLLQALRLHQRRLAPFGVAGSPDVGSEVRLLSRLDPDVEALIRPYCKAWAVA